MYTVVEQCARLGGIIENPFAISPAVGSEEKRHGEKFFPVRRRAPGVFRAVKRAGPGKIAFIPTAAVGRVFQYLGIHIHVGFRPFPNPVEFLLFVQLYAHHHSVGHAFRAYIVVAGVGKITHIRTNFVVNPFLDASFHVCLYYKETLWEEYRKDVKVP